MILKKVVFTGQDPDLFKITDVEADRKTKIFRIMNWGYGGARYPTIQQVEGLEDLSHVDGYYGHIICCYPADLALAKEKLLAMVERRAIRDRDEALGALEAVAAARRRCL